MVRFRGARLALAAVALVASWAATIGTAAGADGAAALFDPATVHVIHLTLSPSSIANLEADPEGEYQPGEFSIATTGGTPDSEGTPSTPVPVEVRLKGSTSFETLDGKAAFKLKFPKDSRPSAFGLKKMTLNNMVQDPSMVHETLAYETFRAAGVPAPRTGFAYVYVNGDDYGVHLNLETLDDQSMESIFATELAGTKFDDPQHLYEGENGADVVPGGASDFQVDEGDETYADLEALIAAVNSTGSARWSERVAPYADLQEMTRMWAVEKYIGHWDGYSGVKETANQPNNYYLYSTPLGLFRMLPWGTDETFQSNRHIAFDGRGSGSLFGLCLDDEACAIAYWHSLEATLGVARGLDLAARVAALDSLLAPWQALEQGNGRFSYSRAEARAEALEAADFADLRAGEAEAWLAAHQPPPEEPEDETPGGGGSGDGGSGGSGGSSGGGSSGSSGGSRSSGSRSAQSGSRSARSGPIAAGEPSPRPRLRHLHATEEGLRSRLRLWTDATVSQRATFATPKGRRTACLIRATSHEAGEVALDCHLRRTVRHRLRHAPLTLHVTTTVKSSASTKTLHSKVKLKRT